MINRHFLAEHLSSTSSTQTKAEPSGLSKQTSTMPASGGLSGYPARPRPEGTSRSPTAANIGTLASQSPAPTNTSTPASQSPAPANVSISVSQSPPLASAPAKAVSRTRPRQATDTVLNPLPEGGLVLGDVQERPPSPALCPARPLPPALRPAPPAAPASLPQPPPASPMVLPHKRLSSTRLPLHRRPRILFSCQECGLFMDALSAISSIAQDPGVDLYDCWCAAHSPPCQPRMWPFHGRPPRQLPSDSSLLAARTHG
nr:uncharacterized protein LOC133608214 [Nerophis lumbriciformis]